MAQGKTRSVRGGYNRSNVKPHQGLTAVDIPEEAPSISILDRNNKFSLINLVPPDFAEYIASVPPKYFTMSERELETELEPDEILNKLKLRFWDEWQVCILSGTTTKLPINAIFYGVCTEEFFYDKVIADPKGLAWVITPPTDYVVTMRDVLRQGLARLKEIVELPIMLEEPIMARGKPVRGDDGKIMFKRTIQKGVITELRQIVTLLTDRVHGAVVQRLDVEQKNISMSLTPETARLLNEPPPKDQPMLAVPDDELSGIEGELSKLNRLLGPMAEEGAEVVDAKVEDE